MQRQFCFLVTAMLLLSCTDQPSNNDNHTASARKMFEAFNRHDWKAMADHYHDSAAFLDPSFGKEYVIQSREATIEKYTGFQKMFPDIHDEIVGMYSADDKVIVEFISTGTADSISFKLPIITVLTFSDGLIVKDATYYDLENP